MKFLLLLLGVLKFGKLATTGATMLVSLAVYASVWGWRYALGFIVLLFTHEMGHVLAARQRGLAVGAPTFVPFVGAWITLKDNPPDAETGAYVAVAGPFIGTLAAFSAYALARELDSQLLLAVAYSGFFLNLFNLLPLSPLDGGRIVAILSPRFWFLGVPIMLGLMIYHPSPALLLVALLAVPQLLAAWRFNPDAPENRLYYCIEKKTKIEYATLYLGLTALLAIMTYNVHDMLAWSRMARI